MSSSSNNELRAPEIVEEVKVKPRKSSFLSVHHPPMAGGGSPGVPMRKKSVGFGNRDIVIIQEQVKAEQMAASPPANDDEVDNADKEVAALRVGEQEEEDDDDSTPSKFKLRPPTPPGVSHKKSEVNVAKK